jgi:hypothetical protein
MIRLEGTLPSECPGRLLPLIALGSPAASRLTSSRTGPASEEVPSGGWAPAVPTAGSGGPWTHVRTLLPGLCAVEAAHGGRRRSSGTLRSRWPAAGDGEAGGRRPVPASRQVAPTPRWLPGEARRRGWGSLEDTDRVDLVCAGPRGAEDESPLRMSAVDQAALSPAPGDACRWMPPPCAACKHVGEGVRSGGGEGSWDGRRFAHPPRAVVLAHIVNSWVWGLRYANLRAPARAGSDSSRTSTPRPESLV